MNNIPATTSTSTWTNLLSATQNTVRGKRYIALGVNSKNSYKLTSKVQEKLPLAKICQISKQQIGKLAVSSREKTTKSICQIRDLTNCLIQHKEDKRYAPFKNILRVAVCIASVLGVITIPICLWLIVEEIKFRRDVNSMKRELDETLPEKLAPLIGNYIQDNLTFADEFKDKYSDALEGIFKGLIEDSLQKPEKLINVLPRCDMKSDAFTPDEGEVEIIEQFIKDVSRGTTFEIYDNSQKWKSTQNDKKNRICESLDAIRMTAAAGDVRWEYLLQSIASQSVHNTLFYATIAELSGMNSDSSVTKFKNDNNLATLALNSSFDVKSTPIKITIHRDDLENITHADVECASDLNITGTQQKGNKSHTALLAEKVLKGKIALTIALNDNDQLEISNFDVEILLG